MPTSASLLANLSGGLRDGTLEVDADTDRVGIGTTNPQATLQVGTGVTVYGNTGIVSATKYYGSGANLTGITAGATLSAGSGDQRVVVTSLTSGAMTSAATDAELTYNSTSNTLSATTFSGALTGTTGTFSGNVSIAGTLTYEDVTNVDSIGIITARSDISIADKIVHTGDTNTAIRFPAADTFTVETAGSEAIRIDSSGRVLIGTTSEIDSSSASNFQIASASGPRLCIARNDTSTASGNLIGALDFYGNDSDGTYENCARILAEADADHTTDSKLTRLTFYTAGSDPDVSEERLRITSAGGIHFANAELIERVSIVANKLSAVPNVNLDNGMVHYYTTNETATANPNIITTAGINTNMATGDTMSVTIMSKPNSAGYFPRISIDGRLAGITTYWSGGSAPSSAESSGVDVNTYQIIKTANQTFDVLANTSNFAW